MILDILPALCGDALLLKWQGSSGRNRNILIDGGVTNTYNQSLKYEIQLLLERKEVIDLLILSHIDSDHIGGVLRLVNEMELRRLPDKLLSACWFNSARVISRYFYRIDEHQRDVMLPHTDKQISTKQGNTLERFLERLQISTNKTPIAAIQEYDLDGLTINVISPDEPSLQRLGKDWQTEIMPSKNVPLAGRQVDYHLSIQELIERPIHEDRGVPNGSSIAFLATHREKQVLLLADAHPSVIIASLQKQGYSDVHKLKVDCVKVSHHGSKHNTNEALLALLDCNRFIVSTNGSNTHGLPHKEALARIIYHNYQRGQPTELIFNYRNAITEGIFSPSEMQAFGFQCSFQNEIVF